MAEVILRTSKRIPAPAARNYRVQFVLACASAGAGPNFGVSIVVLPYSQGLTVAPET